MGAGSIILNFELSFSTDLSSLTGFLRRIAKSCTSFNPANPGSDNKKAAISYDAI
jgi:hypothetical protein